MKKLAGIVFFLCVLGLIGGCASTVRQGKCQDDNDCPEGQTCVNDVCEGGVCTVDADCLEGQECKDGKCTAKTTPPPTTCEEDKDCKDGEVCLDGKCMECGKDSDCKDGKVCKNNSCVDKTTPPPTGCKSNSDCKAPTPVCDSSNGKCVECLSNSDCKDSSKPVCTNKTCVAKTDECDVKDIKLNGKCYKVSAPDDPKCYTVSVNGKTALIGERFKGVNRVASKDAGGPHYNYNDAVLTTADPNDPRVVWVHLVQVPYKYYKAFFKSADGKSDRWPLIVDCVRDKDTKAEAIEEPNRPGVKTHWLVHPEK